MSWRPGWEICLGSVELPNGERCALAPRELLHRALEAMGSLGLEVMAAFEYEIRISGPDGSPVAQNISYSLADMGVFEEFSARLAAATERMGIGLAAIHTEAAPGLLEINIDAATGIRAADDACLLKLVVKDVATTLGLRASFMAKPVAGEEGSSGHVHMSCWRDGHNAFAADAGLSDECRWAIGGLLEHLPAASLLLNPTINSYKRLVPGWFAPVNATWGYENRSCAVRAIRAERPSQVRFECRRPGADANPYLALAALVAAAADGIRRRLEPPEPVTGDVSARPGARELPGSLEAALIAFRSNGAFTTLIGRDFSEFYAVSREWELSAFRGAVSDWERARYERSV
jgi:glutamine synthetase